MGQQGDDATVEESPRWRTRANALTLVRAAIAPALAYAIGTDRPEVATALFFTAVATDFADGMVARRYGETSPLGGLLDHAVDAALCVLGLGALASVGAIPWPLPLLVAIAFAQYTIDSRGHEGQPLRASRLGRWNGIAYYVLVAVPICRETLGWSQPSPMIVWWMGSALAVSTVASMLSRLTEQRG